MSKFIIVNNTGSIHTENRPGVGFISIPANKSFECFDVKDPDDPKKVLTTAKDLANSIVMDAGGTLKIAEVPDSIKPKVIERRVINKIGDKAKVITRGKGEVGK